MSARDWSKSASSNTTTGGIYIGAGMARSDVDNGMRAMMAELRPIIDGVAISLSEYGAIADGTTDNSTAMTNAMAALPSTGGTIFVPWQSGDTAYYFASPINVRKKIKLVGGGPAQGTATQGCKFTFAAGISGLLLNSATTSNRALVASDANYPGAFGSEIENIMFYGGGGVAADGHDGVVIRAKVVLRNVHARNWARNGFDMVADANGGDETEGDANGTYLENCQGVLNGQDGFHTDDDDANVCVFMKCQANSNTRHGFYENSLIGNTYIGCDTLSNGGNSIYATRASAANTLIGFWEDGSGEAELGDGCIAIGGDGGRPSATSTGLYLGPGGLAKNAPLRYYNTKGSEQVYSALGKNDTSLTALSFSAESEGDEYNWKLQFNTTDKAFQLEAANSSTFRPIAFPNSASALYTARSFAGPLLTQGYAVRAAGGAASAATVVQWGSAAPTTGTWRVGDITYNTAPTAGGTIGWVCTTAGVDAAAVWKTFGSIAA